MKLRNKETFFESSSDNSNVFNYFNKLIKEKIFFYILVENNTILAVRIFNSTPWKNKLQLNNVVYSNFIFNDNIYIYKFWQKAYSSVG